MWKNTATGLGKRRYLLPWLAYGLVLVAVAVGAYTFGRSQSPANLGPQDRKDLALYAQALNIVQNDYVDQKAVDPKKQTYGAIEGMLNSLGDKGHTRFLTPSEVKQNQKDLSGSYVGIGVTLETKGKDVVVSSPLDGSPAERAGVKSGDIIVAVNSDNVRGEDAGAIANKVRGPKGSKVKLTMLRGGKKLVFSMKRAELQIPVTSWSIIPGSDVAHIQLTSFSDNSADELAAAFHKAKAAGARRFILDLRDNPGGRLDQSVAMGGLFLHDGSVVYIRKEASGKREKERTSGTPEFPNAPMVVLVNGGTASSAEILAGALRDDNRATLVGTSTYGTGTVLSEYSLKDGSAILLGIAEWLTPSGHFIRESGIKPDIISKLKKGDEPISASEDKNMSREKIFERDSQLSRAFKAVRSS